MFAMSAYVIILLSLVTGSFAQDSFLIKNEPGCQDYLALSKSVQNSTLYVIKASVESWQAVVLLLAFAIFAVLISIVHKLIRKYIFYDAHLLDTFFDAGADVNMGLIACSVATKWAWTATVSWSSGLSKDFGLVGHFLYSAGAAIQLFLFAIVIVEIRIKSPGAKTFLQVIRSRFGAKPHIMMIFFALLTNILISGMVMSEGSVILSTLTDGLGKEVICIILSIVIGIITVVGGVGGGIYVAYFSCSLLLVIMLYYLTDVYYDPLNRDDNPFGSVNSVFNVTQCGKGHKDNNDRSLLTFLSPGGLPEGIVVLLCAFSSVFVNQSFWQTGISAKPGHSVWGFLSGGLVWFAIPFCSAFALGMTYWAFTIETGGHLISDSDALQGLVPVLTSQKLLGKTGDFLMFTFVMVAVVTTVSGEVLSMASIILYDIYQTYIAPFDNTITKDIDGNTTIRAKRQLKNEEFLVYNKRCSFLRYAVVICSTILLIPITLVIMAIGIDLQWLFKFLGIVVGSSVLPVVMAITWHRITGVGMMAGVLVGLPSALLAWLVYASQLDGGLTNFRENTNNATAVLIGSGVALGMGGFICCAVSLFTGGCSGDLMEEEEWEKTRKIDNPVLPWTVRYAPDIGASQMVKGKPHFYTVRRAFKVPEITAYIFGVLLTVVVVLVWPACMLLVDVMQEGAFKSWTTVVLLIGVAATVYVTIVPVTWEAVQTCRQVYYNRRWADFGHERLQEVPSELNGRVGLSPFGTLSPAPKERPAETQSFHTLEDIDTSSNQPLGKDNSSTGSNEKERWKTFIDIN